MEDESTGRHGSGGPQPLGDVLATTDLVDRDGLVARDGRVVRDRVGGASLGRPLAYRLPAPSGTAPAGRPRDLLLCFPFDLEKLPGGRRFHEVALTVLLDDGLQAMSLHPAPASTEPGGGEVAAFGLGRDRLRWVFRAPPGRNGALRPDGRWAQTVVRLPPGSAEVTGRLRLNAVTVRPVLGGTFVRTEAETPDDVPFRLTVADAWPAASPLVDHGALPGAWALAGYEESRPTQDEGLPPGLRRLCLAVDIERYSTRDNADMVRLQRALLRTLRTACQRAGIEWHTCGRQAQGDGYLLVLEPGIDETRAVPALLDGLATGLAEANAQTPPGERGLHVADTPPRDEQQSQVTDAPPRDQQHHLTDPSPPDQQQRHVADAPPRDQQQHHLTDPSAPPPRPIRMRVSLHQGIVHEADSGYAGSAVVALFRVLDSAPLRRALADDASAGLAVAFSDGLYTDLVAHGYDGLSSAGFRREEVHDAAKSFSAAVWIRVVAGT
ncbi:hypothetical protein [Streptomyces sp. 8N706]|uniref:hypothetical protein n=1 Tax=Streptomyces sp. 8N706 TaxID=3457416 RepID=UPI003FD5CB79